MPHKDPERRAEYDRQRNRSPARRALHARWRAEHPDYDKEWRVAHPNYNREWHAQHPNYRQADPSRKKARAAAGWAWRRGKLTKLDCEVCGSAHRVEAHHPFGYTADMALAVWWLCRPHHMAMHRA